MPAVYMAGGATCRTAPRTSQWEEELRQAPGLKKCERSGAKTLWTIG